MKRLLLTLVTILLVVSGCGNESAQVVPYDNSELKAKLKDAPFQAMLPTKMPAEVTKTEVEEVGEDYIRIAFDGPGEGKHGSHFVLSIQENAHPGQLVNSIEVNIGDVKGVFAESISEMRYLDWTVDNVTYRLYFVWSESDIIVTKDQLIKTAESFK